MRTIFKYPLDFLIQETIIEIPANHQFLSLQVQKGQPVAYFIVDTDREDMKLKIWCCGTGGEAPPVTYLPMGSAMLDDGNYVWHFFYRA